MAGQPPHPPGGGGGRGAGDPGLPAQPRPGGDLPVGRVAVRRVEPGQQPRRRGQVHRLGGGQPADAVRLLVGGELSRIGGREVLEAGPDSGERLRRVRRPAAAGRRGRGGSARVACGVSEGHGPVTSSGERLSRDYRIYVRYYREAPTFSAEGRAGAMAGVSV